jgi:hypothetical protein
VPGTRLTYVYTSRAEMQRLFSARGTTLRIEDLNSTDQDEYFVEVCEDASDIINQYVENIYDQSDLVNSRWVRIRATWIACYLFSQRRANPALLVGRYQEILEELEKVRLQILDIPGLAKRDNFFPAMSNMTVDPHYPIRSVRVVESISTDSTHTRQERAYMWPSDWL